MTLEWVADMFALTKMWPQTNLIPSHKILVITLYKITYESHNCECLSVELKFCTIQPSIVILSELYVTWSQTPPNWWSSYKLTYYSSVSALVKATVSSLCNKDCQVHVQIIITSLISQTREWSSPSVTAVGNRAVIEMLYGTIYLLNFTKDTLVLLTIKLRTGGALAL